MIKIGITGSLASGKSAASKILATRKGPLFSADKEVKRLYKNTKFKRVVANKFGFKNFKKIKEKIKKKILNDKSNIKKLEKIIHPLVRKELNKFIKLNAKRKFIFFEVPLLIESKLMKLFDIIIFIKANKNIRFKRFRRKGGNSKLFKILNQKQLNDETKIKFCDHVVVNEKEGHKIVEIACVETQDLISTGRMFHKLINPQRDVPEEAFKVHGFSRDFLKDKETFDQIADEFLNFIRGKKIIIHNASFDLSFLNGELSNIKKELVDKKMVIDSLEVARNKFPGTSNSLDALCKKFNIDLSKRNKHNALLDCELLREVYINLLDVKEPKFNLSSSLNEKIIINNKNYNKEIIKISDDEIKMHKEFLKRELKKNFY